MTKMGISRAGLIALLGAALAAGIAVGYYLPKSAPKPAKPVGNTAVKPHPRRGIPLSIKQNGKPVAVGALIDLYRTNPNRFVVNTEKSIFIVEGRIVKVGEASALDEVTGFHVPLSSASDESQFFNDMLTPQQAVTRSVSLFVKGLSKSDLADFDPGDLISAQCPKIRIVGDDLVFDECRLQGKPIK